MLGWVTLSAISAQRCLRTSRQWYAALTSMTIWKHPRRTSGRMLRAVPTSYVSGAWSELKPPFKFITKRLHLTHIFCVASSALLTASSIDLLGRGLFGFGTTKLVCTIGLCPCAVAAAISDGVRGTSAPDWI